MATNDGGPAFPGTDRTEPSDGGQVVHFGPKGMTLRDWLAGQALAGLLARNGFRPDAAARESYAVADAMLRESGRR